MNKTNILEFLEETVSRYPDKVALSDGVDSLTFSEIVRKAQALGSALLEKGISGQAVAVLADKHPDTVCAFWGALYAGCFYFCIEPEMPDLRILSAVEKTRAKAVICRKKTLDRARILSGRAEILCFEELSEHAADTEALRRIREKHIDKSPAYIVFTSGSTGEPKGVCASHRSVIDYCDALCKTLGFDENTVFGNQAPLYYDAPLKELLPSISLGASVLLISKEKFLSPLRLFDFMREKGVNTLCWAASALAMISSLGVLEKTDMSFLKTVCFGSEVFPKKEYEKWRAACPRARFINLYGPTEATGMSCYWMADRILADGEPIPIGRPFPNTEILLLGDDGKPVTDGESGEIYICGSCVAHGYFGDSYMTESSFVQNPLNLSYPDVVYRTGDMAKMNERGELVYLGRRDRQIKLMGRRIEPMEIEAAACECVGVSMAALIFEREREHIILYYVGEAEPSELRKNLCRRLPAFMLPRLCIKLECMPRKENGKLDRAQIANMAGNENEQTSENFR